MNINHQITYASSLHYDYIDFAKGLVMTSVIWGHILTAGWSLSFIYSFHMPFFFFVSGMLFKERKYSTFISFCKSRCKTLLRPYLYYSVIIWCVWALYQYLGCGTISHCWKSLLETLLARSGGGFYLHNSVLWFIPCLFVTEMLYYFLKKMKSAIRWSVIIALVIVNIVLTRVYGDAYVLAIPWNVDSAVMALPFYAVGHLVTSHFSLSDIQRFINAHSNAAIFFVIMLTVFLLWAGTAFGMCSIGCSRFGYSEVTFYLRAFVGCATTIVFSALVVQSNTSMVFMSKCLNYIKWVGQSSIDFMCTHIPIKGVLVVAMAKMLCITTLEDGSWNDNSMFHLAIVTFVATMFIDSILVYLIRRYVKNKNC